MRSPARRPSVISAELLGWYPGAVISWLGFRFFNARYAVISLVVLAIGSLLFADLLARTESSRGSIRIHALASSLGALDAAAEVAGPISRIASSSATATRTRPLPRLPSIPSTVSATLSAVPRGG